jgi:hypothetical protein
MYIRDLLKENTIDEAPMNPTAFAGAIEQGQGAGVLVGFEFEVHVPEDTYAKKPEEEPAAPKTVADVDESLYYDSVWSTIVGNTQADIQLTPAWFDSMFKFRQPMRGFSTAAEAYPAFKDSILPNIIKLYNKLTPKQQKKYSELAVRRIRNDDPRFSFASKKLSDQIKFGRMVGYFLYMQNNNNELEQIGSRLRDIDGNTWKGFLIWLTNDDRVDTRTSRHFIYDPVSVYETLRLSDNDDEDWEEEEDDNYEKASEFLQPLIKTAMGCKVRIFNSYHEHDKNLKDWYIEPDGSLEPNDSADASAEIVSPPLPVGEAIDALKKFYALAGQYGLYTNSTTGLHINVSIPQKLDLLKLAVFLGDEYVLKYFGREGNDYARSVQKHLGREVQRSSNIDLQKLQSMANNATSGHTSSISNNGKYISFRHAGGDYLRDYQGVFNVIGRFVRAMIIATDPAAYANEYQTKLAKLMQGPETDQIQKNTSTERVLQFIRTKGAPIAVASLYTKRADAVKVAVQGMKSYDIKLAPATAQPGAAAKTEVINKVKKPEFKQKLEAQDANRFSSFTFIPDSIKTLGQLAQVQFPTGVNPLIKEVNWNDTTIGYWYIEKIMLPPSDPRIQNLIKLLLKQQYAKK